MRRLGSLLAVVVVVAAAVVLAGADDGGSDVASYRVELDNAFGLTEGGDLKIAGVRAGQTTGFEISNGRPRKALVEFEITEPGVGVLREDVNCAVRPQSLIGEYFLDCQPGEGEPLDEGATIPVEQTSSTLAIDLVNNVLRRPYRERLRLIIAELGTGLAGRSEELSQVLRRAHPGLRETSKTLDILARQRRTIQQFITDAATVVDALERRKADVTRFVTETADTAEATAARREDLRENFRRLPGFLSELGSYAGRLEGLADEQIPLLADLERGAPALDTFLARLGPFADASRPAFRGLGEASEAGTAAFRAFQREVDTLRTLARKAPATAKPLRQLLRTLDDRDRAVEDDPRAAATGPPAPDKTAIPAGEQGGFTGMEALLDYFYWQGLAINGRDAVGHVLRIIGVDDMECFPYYATRVGSEEIFDRCNQFLGPDQPGVTTPDPIAGGAASAGASDERGSGRRRPGADRRSGDGDSGPTSPAPTPVPGAGGQPGDAPAAPESTLPPALEDLLGDVDSLLGRRPRPQAPAPPMDQALLDFLLSP